jgi:hypothetical protein
MWLLYAQPCLRVRLRLKCDGTSAETRFRLSAKRTSPFKSARASVQSTTGSRGVRISGSNVGYTMFRGSVKGTGYPLHSPVYPSLPLPCVTVCHHISAGVSYQVSVQPICDYTKQMPFLLGAFTKFRKATAGFVTSVCSSVCMEQIDWAATGRIYFFLI